MGTTTIKTIFFDLGGVCLSNGWDREQRKVITDRFQFDNNVFDRRHRQIVDALERGQCTLAEYLHWTIFYEPRPFSSADITEAIMQLSTAYPATLDIVRALRQKSTYFLATLNNESQELNADRINRFGLTELFSAFFSSCYFGLLKPQPEFYRRALQIAHCAPNECVFVDDRPMNVEVAEILGMHAIQFVDAPALADSLRALGVSV